MGVVIATITQQQLISYQQDLEEDILLINQSKISLSGAVNDLLTAGTDLDPNSPIAKQLEARKQRLALLEKKLDMQLAEKQSRLAMVQKNLQACEKMAQG